MSKGFGNKIKNISDTNLLLTITVVVFFLMYIGAMIFQGEGFLKPQALFNILNANAALIILSCGMSIVMITGGIDISVGGVTALISMCCAVYLDKAGGNVAVSVLIALLIGLAFGLVQGFLVAYLEIQPFIVTLAGMFFARGMTTIVNTEPFNVANEAFVALKNTRIIVPGMGCDCPVLCVKMDKAWPHFLCGGRKQPERSDAWYQRKENKVYRASALRRAGRHRRLCVFPACRFRFSFPRKRRGDERHRFFHYRRHHADRRRWKYYRNILWSAFLKYDPEYRFFRRT